MALLNTGRSIPPEHHSRIFEKFGQVDGQKNKHFTGLGLTFCKLAIKAHRGSVGVVSNEEDGTTFWFTLLATLKVPKLDAKN